MGKKVWKRKRYPGNHYGCYGIVDNERVFILKKPGGGARYVYESHQAATKAGWKAS